MRMILLALATLGAATAPLLPDRVAAVPPPVRWPLAFDGKALTRLPTGPSDTAFTRGFPGHVAHFSDGKRHILLRHVRSATRSLHPSRDCYRAMGYDVAPLPLAQSPDGQSRACFAADKGRDHFKICEEVRDAKGNSFPEVTAWYWPAFLGTSQGPWVAATIVEQRG